MWKLEIEQDYKVLEFEFPDLLEAVDFIEKASQRSKEILVFRLRKDRKEGDE